MKQLNSYSILLELIMLLLASNLEAALLTPEVAEIPYQIKKL